MDIPVQSGKKNNLTRLWRFKVVVLIGLGVLITLPLILGRGLPDVESSELWTGTVKSGSLKREVRGVGTLVPTEFRWVAASSPGRVERILVKPGAKVDANTVIAELSNPDLYRQHQQAKWELDAADARLLALKAELEEQRLEQEWLVTQAQMELESAKMLEKAQQPLASNKIISDLDFENTKLKKRQSQALVRIRKQRQLRRDEVIHARMAAEEAQVRKYRNLVASFNDQIKELSVFAGISGVLQEVSVEVGERVQIGLNIARVARPESLIAELQIQEVQAKDIQLNLPVSIDTRNGLVAGQVIRVDPRVNQGNVQVDVELIETLPAGARPDLSVVGTILVEHIKQTVFVERPVGAHPNSEVKLFRFDRDTNIARQLPVRTGKASVNKIEVLDGLAVGDRVVISDTSSFHQHAAIIVN